MTVILTPRLKLAVDDGTGDINVQHANWDRVDKASGELLTVKGVDIPVGELYDGALVAEKDTGISWRCVDDGAGGFNKVYLNYPWQITAFSQRDIASSSLFWGWDNFYPPDSLNSTAADLNSSGGIIAPIKALYSGTIQQLWLTGSPVGIRTGALALDRVIQYNTDNRHSANAGWVVTTQEKINQVINKGQEILSWIGQDSGIPLNMYTSIFLQVVRPVA